jgi:cell division protein FtsL
MYDLALWIVGILFIFAIVVLYYVLKINRAQKEIEILNSEIEMGKKERERVKNLKKEIKHQ